MQLSDPVTCDPNGIRTRATGVKGQRPRPLNDGALETDLKYSYTSHRDSVGFLLTLSLLAFVLCVGRRALKP